MNSPILKLAAAALITVAALIVTYQFRDSLNRAVFSRVYSPGNARKCKTLTWKITILDEAMIARGMALEPYYVKIVWPSGRVWLLDRRKRKVFLIDPAKKIVMKMVLGRDVPDIYADICGSIRNYENIPGYSIEHIGQRRMCQRQVTGLHLKNKKQTDEMIFWVDSQSQLPVQIEFFEANKLGQMEPEITWSEIVYDVELDESLFKYDLEGYNVEEVDSLEVN